MKIYEAVPEDSENIAEIHFNNFKNAFLCDLGIDFLKLLYKWILSFNNGFGYVVKDADANISGFVTGLYDSSTLIKSFIRNNLIKTTPLLFAALFKKHRNIKNIFETVFYSKKTEVNIKAELLSIAVEDSIKNKGCGKELFIMFMARLKSNHINICKIIVDKDNTIANNFYIKCGCELVKSYKMYGKITNIYKYIIK
jgi:ribosomal protein S18 acetylase RimI-like enzyme